MKRTLSGPIAPYEWRCDMSHVTANTTSTAKIVMNITQRVHILPTITVTPFLIQSTSPVYLRATGKHGTVTVANYGLLAGSERSDVVPLRPQRVTYRDGDSGLLSGATQAGRCMRSEADNVPVTAHRRLW